MHSSHSDARDYFDSTTEAYSRKSTGRVSSFSALIFQRRIQIVERFVRRLPKGGKVLDFGMGPAVFCAPAVDHGLSYLGVDIAPKMVEEARALNIPGATFEVGDLDALGKYQDSQDAVLAIGLIDYLEIPDDGFRALSQCVKPKGHVIVSFRNKYSVPRTLRDVAKAVWRTLSGGPAQEAERAFFSAVHEKAFSRSELEAAFRKHDFETFEVGYFNCSPFFFDFPLPGPLWKLWLALDSVLARGFTSFMCSGGVLLGRKKA